MKILNVQEKDVFVLSNEIKYISEFTYLWPDKKSFQNDTGVTIPDNVFKMVYEPIKNMYIIVDYDLKSQNFSNPNEHPLLKQIHENFDNYCKIGLDNFYKQHGKIYDKDSDTYIWDNNYLINHVKGIRNQILNESDYLLNSDYPITEELKNKVITFRQFLRDISSQENFPKNISFTSEINNILSELNKAGYDYTNSEERLNVKPIIPGE